MTDEPVCAQENCGHPKSDHPNFFCYGDDGECRCGGWKKQT